MKVHDSMRASYPHIFKYLGPWLQQLLNMSGNEEYKIILNEFERVWGGIAQEEREQNLERLDRHIDIASRVCSNFQSLFSEKRELGNDVEKANEAIFDKLAEIRAIVGLHRLDFKDIKFIKHPDLFAKFKGKNFLVEVTRLGNTTGKRADIYDSDTIESESGIRTRQIFDGEKSKSVGVISEAIYYKIVDKYGQFRNPKYQSDGWIVWISIGRDYLTVPKYVMEYTEALAVMPNAKRALDLAMQEIIKDKKRGLYSCLSYSILSLGRDDSDLVSPELRINV